jgi:predicted nucleic acid-binding protein
VSYWDAAYIAKFYLDEPESDRVRALAEAEGEASCSRFGYLETVSVFHRKMREGIFRQADLRELCNQLEADSEAGLWSWLPTSPAVIQLASATYRGVPKSVALRASDALHLATARVNGIAKVFSNDVRLLSAARYFDVSGSDPAGT